MKTQYAPSILAFVRSAKKNLTAGTNSWGLPKEASKAEREWHFMSSHVKYAIQAEMTDSPEEKSYRAELKAKLGFTVWPDRTAKHDGLLVTFRGDHNFKTREELLEWSAKVELEIPTECKKEGVIVGEEIHTKITHRVVVADDCIVTVSYVRPGSPTPHCRVQTSTYSEVICELEH